MVSLSAEKTLARTTESVRHPLWLVGERTSQPGDERGLGRFTTKVSRRSSLIYPFVAAMLLGACADDGAQPQANQPIEQSSLTPLSASDNQTAATAAASRTFAEPRTTVVRRMGTDRVINPRTTQVVVDEEPGDRFSINLIDVPVEQAVRAVLGETLGFTYAVSADVQGNVTVQTSRPVSRSDLLEMFETVLSLNGLAIERLDGSLLVVPSSVSTPEFRTLGNGAASGVGVYVIPLRFVGVAEMARILEPIASPTLSLSASRERNILFATGRRTDVEAVVEAVNVFDIDIMQGRSVSRVQLTGMVPSDVAVELEAVFDTGPGGALDGVLRFVPNNELASLLIISSRQRYIRQVESWIRDAERVTHHDTPVAVVYDIENREAEDLVPVLQTLLNQGDFQVGVDGAQQAVAVDGEQAIAVETTGVVADTVSNSVIAYATPSDHRQISELVRQLDDVAEQVLLEATIAEVSLNDELDFGIRYFFESGNFAVNFSSLVTSSVAPILPGFNAIFDAGGAAIALNALSAITEVSILSSPSLMVMDNREATLNVGEQVPVATSSAVGVSDPDAPIVNTIEQRDTGVILNIRPRVSASGRVILDVRQEVSDVVATQSSGIDSPTIQQRVVSTTVAVDDGQSLVIGGLIRERQSRQQDKIPFLGDIPVLGALFRDTSDSDSRTELLIIITPRVVRNTLEAREITEEYRRALSGPSELVGAKPTTLDHQLKRIFY